MISPDARLHELADVQVLTRVGNGSSPARENVAGGATPSAGPLPLPFTAWGDIEGTTEPQDFVEGLLLAESMSVIFGEPGAGKSFFAADLAMHVAAGRMWRDREVDQGAVVYVALEGSKGFHNRIQAAKRELGFPPDMPFALVTTPLNMLDPAADVHRVIATIRTASMQFGLPVSLIVIDTLARSLAGGNENASEAMGAFVVNCDRIRHETAAHVMAVHHSGKDAAKGARGHSSLKGAVDTEIELTRDGSSRVATVIKQRDLAEDDRFPFSLRVVAIGTDRRGKPITTALVEHESDDFAPTSQAKKLPLREASALLLRSIQDAFASGRGVPLRLAADGPVVQAVSRSELRARLIKDGWFSEGHICGEKLEKPAYAAENNGLKSLKVRGFVGFDRNSVWLL